MDIYNIWAFQVYWQLIAWKPHKKIQALTHVIYVYHRLIAYWADVAQCFNKLILIKKA